MATHNQPEFTCDNCGKKLPTFGNNVVIVTPKREGSIAWQRIVVTLENHHGSHNDGKRDKADLCKKCAVSLLKDALARVKAGERLSAGVETSRKLGFDEPF